MAGYDLDLSMGLRGYTGAAQHRKPKRVKTRRARGSLAYYPYCDFSTPPLTKELTCSRIFRIANRESFTLGLPLVLGLAAFARFLSYNRVHLVAADHYSLASNGLQGGTRGTGLPLRGTPYSLEKHFSCAARALKKLPQPQRRLVLE